MSFDFQSICDVLSILMLINCVDENVQLLNSWLHQKPAVLELHIFKRGYTIESWKR